MVEEAQSRRAPSEQWVERFARYYTPAMLAIAVLVAVIPPLVGGGQWGAWFYQALVILVIACPCALVISTPVSIVAGLATAARGGVLIKGGAHLEAPARLQAIALDKTGTLTYGQPTVQRVVSFNGHSERELLTIAAALETNSTHPLARAVLDKARSLEITGPSATNFQALLGMGAEGDIDGKRFWIGSHRLMEERGIETPEAHQTARSMEDAAHSVIAVGNDHHVCGLIGVADGIRPQSATAIQALKKLGIKKVVMLTGDNQQTAAAVAEATGVDEIRAELLPADKVAAVTELMAQYRHVAMVGDGVNAVAVVRTSAAVGTRDVERRGATRCRRRVGQERLARRRNSVGRPGNRDHPSLFFFEEKSKIGRCQVLRLSEQSDLLRLLFQICASNFTDPLRWRASSMSVTPAGKSCSNTPSVPSRPSTISDAAGPRGA